MVMSTLLIGGLEVQVRQSCAKPLYKVIIAPLTSEENHGMLTPYYLQASSKRCKELHQDEENIPVLRASNLVARQREVKSQYVQWRSMEAVRNKITV